MTQMQQAPMQDATPQQSELAPPEHVVIKCAGLTKVFRDFWMRNRVKAVDGIDLEVHRGEVFGLLGPNGSGKSTTIKMILGLLHPTAGRIAIFGKHPRDVAIKEEIGYLPEESYLYRFLNARETLEYYGRLFHQGRRQRKQRIEMLLEMVGLDKVAHRPVGEYSKGMQRRIGLAQALINDPQLLILDEPTTGLDPIGTRQIKDLIQELADRGKTVLLCSHLLADVEDVCARVSIMYGGKIRQQGTVDQLLVKSGITDIHAANLSAEDIQAIEQLLESRGKHIERIDQPRQRLETLFLDIVHTAQSEGVDTSGAGSGGQIAEFLSSGGRELAADAEPERVIEQLVQPEQPAAQEAQPAEPRDVPQPADESSPDDVDADAGADAVLDQLVSDHAPSTPASSQHGGDDAPGDENASSPDAASQPGQQHKPQDESEDEGVDAALLDSLLGGDESRNDEDQQQEQRRDKPS